MSLIVTAENPINRVVAPRLPSAPVQYQAQFQEKYSNILRLYFNQLDNILGQLMAATSTLPVSIGGTNVDAFGRIRVSQPYTLFDSQNRFAADRQFDTALTGTGSSTWQVNQSSVAMTVTSGGIGSVVRQTYRVFPYQPGKSLLLLATFAMSGSVSANLTQRVGYFSTQNGVFFQRTAGVNSFVLRSYTTGAVSDARTIDQSAWNGDKLNGTGPSGLTLDPSKTQILWMDFEWLGVGSVRCGFIIDGEYIVCHTFDNANIAATVYMTTAILPVRYEITSTSAVAATLTQICCSVASEGGYEQTSLTNVARRTASLTGISTTFLPLLSIRLASTALGAVVLPNRINVMPLTADTFEIVLVKNPTLGGAPSWSAVASDPNVEMDTDATSYTGGDIVQSDYAVATNQGSSPLISATGYNWDLQLGVSIAGVSDVYTIGVRTLSGTGTAVGALSFFDLTQ
jgi:hypothetical protein